VTLSNCGLLAKTQPEHISRRAASEMRNCH